MTLVSLVSQQPIPNIIVSLQLKPSLTILISTKDQLNVAKNIEKVLNMNHLQAFTYHRLAEPYDFNSTKYICRDIKRNDIVLNITGGTKIMSLAAYDEFKNHAIGIIYCDTFNNKVLFMNNCEYIDITAKITLQDYLTAFGYEIIESRTCLSSINNSLFEFIYANNLLDSFVELTKKVRESIKLNSEHQNCATDKWQYNKDIDNANIVYLPDKIKFKLEHPKYIHGDWLEQITFWVLKQSQDKHNINDIAFNIKLKSDNEVFNEIDLAFIKNCKLHLISCKSGMKEGNEALYELETLKHHTGGTFSKAYNVITRTPTEAYINRSIELGIKIIKINELYKHSFN